MGLLVRAVNSIAISISLRKLHRREVGPICKHIFITVSGVACYHFCYVILLLFNLFWVTLACALPGLTPGSALKDHSGWDSGNGTGCWIELCKACTVPAMLSL